MYYFKVVKDHMGSDDAYTAQGKQFGNIETKQGFERQVMTIYDDDDICYYTIHYWGDEDEQSIFAPLDWASYNAGATKCKINGEWL